MMFVAWAFAAQAQSITTIKLADGAVLNASPIAPQDAHIQLRLESGGYTNVPWARLSQETLQQLSTNRATATYARYASVFLDPPASSQVRTTRRKVDLNPVPRLDRPAGGSLFASPIMIVLLLIVYGANIYAAYEISIFRQHPPALVCVLAAVFPVVAPGLFLAIPPRQPSIEEAPVEMSESEVVEETTVTEEQASDAAPAVEPAAPQAIVYPRGQFTFNRRFFETKFAGFLKMVPGEAERDKEIYIKSARGEHVGQRLSRIEPNEIYLQVRKGPATEDVMIPFNEIYEVQVRPVTA